jgi:hypothetical protein
MKPHIEIEYNKDFYNWTLHNADLIRQQKFAEVDIEHVAEEIESMGNRDRRELINRLAVLIAHLLKWEYQPNKRSKSWKLTIKEQRIKVLQLLEESPSLKHQLALKFNAAYEQAIVMAEIETGLEESAFPKESPFNLDQCLDHHFFPGE